MRKLKHRFIERILPVWARAELLSENESLRKENRQLRDEVERLQSYINGLHAGMRSQRRIVINTGEVTKK